LLLLSRSSVYRGLLNAPSGFPQGNSEGRPTRKFCGGANGVERKSHFPRQYVGCPSRQQAERNLAARETVDHFVDGAIPAANQDNVPTLSCRFFCQFRRRPGPSRRRNSDFHSHLAEDFSHSPNLPCAPGRASSSYRVIDESRGFQTCGFGLRKIRFDPGVTSHLIVHKSDSLEPHSGSIVKILSVAQFWFLIPPAQRCP
jgi:hypothetical protein